MTMTIQPCNSNLIKHSAPWLPSRVGGLESSRVRSNTPTQPAELNQVCLRREIVLTVLKQRAECGFLDKWVVVERYK